MLVWPLFELLAGGGTSAEISVLWTEIVWLVIVGCLTPLQLECGLI